MRLNSATHGTTSQKRTRSADLRRTASDQRNWAKYGSAIMPRQWEMTQVESSSVIAMATNGFMAAGDKNTAAAEMMVNMNHVRTSGSRRMKALMIISPKIVSPLNVLKIRLERRSSTGR